MKRLVTFFAVLIAFVVIIYAYGIDSLIAKQQKTLDDVITSAGQFVRNERQLFLSGLDYKEELTEDKVVIWVNGLPISNNELQMRFRLQKASGLGTQTIKEVKNELIREKVIKKEAEKLNLLPTDEEVNKFISKEKEIVKNNPEYEAAVKKLISDWGLTEDEYWNVYERYNIYRLVILDKLGRHIISDYYSKDKVFDDDTKKAKEVWNKFVAEKIAKAEIKENEKFLK